MWCALPGYQMAPYTESWDWSTHLTPHTVVSALLEQQHPHPHAPFARQISVPGLKVICSGSAAHKRESRKRWGQHKCPPTCPLRPPSVSPERFSVPVMNSLYLLPPLVSPVLSLSLHDTFHVISPTKIKVSAFPKTCDRRRCRSLSLSYSYCAVCIHIL